MASATPASQSTPGGSTPNPPQGGQRAGVTNAIQVSPSQKELLIINEVMEVFLTKLEEQGIQVDSESLYTDRIVILQGDPVRARECLDSVICWDVVEFPPADKSTVVSKLTDLRRRFDTQFIEDVSHADAGRAEVAFLPSIKEEVLAVLNDLKFRTKLIPLPNYLLEFLKRHMRSFRAKFVSSFSVASSVDLSLVDTDPNQKPRLQLNCERSRFPEAARLLVKRLSLLCNRRVEVKRPLGNYLQTSPGGKRQIQAIEDRHHCALKVQVQGDRLLLEARSPGGHVVRMYEGGLAGSECPLLVLPVWEGQEKWQQPSYEVVLQRGCLSSNASNYLSRMGPPPKDVILVLQCQQLASGQSVVIMYVPQRSHEHFQDIVTAGITEAMTHAKSVRDAIALPLALCGDTYFRVVLTSVCACYNDDNLPPLVHFYLDPGSTGLDDIAGVFQSKNWTVEMPTDSVDAIFDQRMKVLIGDILDTKADVTVNSTDPKLEHAHGQVSRLFLRHLGDDLIRQCRQLYPGGIGDHIVAITPAGGLNQFKHIFHVCLPQKKWSDQSADELLQALRMTVEACLCLASVKGLKSIVFPALATGTLQYPADVEARAVLDTTREFFSCMPHSSLRQVTFVAYKKNPPVVKVFKAEETFFRYSSHRVADCARVDRRFEVRKVLVQVIKGDATTRRCSSELLICASPPCKGTLQDYQKQMNENCNLAIVNSKTMRNDVRDALKQTSATSVQINMQTFDADQIDNLVSGIEKANSQTVEIIVIIVFSPNAYLRLCNKLARSYSSPTNGSHTGTRFRTKAHVSICGAKTKDTSEAAKEVLGLATPDKYIEADKASLHPSFLEPPVSSAANPERPAGSRPGGSAAPSVPATDGLAPGPPAVLPVASGGSAQQPQAQQAQQAQAQQQSQVQEPTTLSIPREQLRGVDMGTMIDLFLQLDITVSFRKGATVFRADQANQEQLRDRVQRTLAGLVPGAPRAAPTGSRAPGVQVPAAPVSSPAQPLAAGGGGDLTASIVLQSAGSLNIPSTFRAQQATVSQDFDKNIQFSPIGQSDSGKNDDGKDLPGDTGSLPGGTGSFVFVDTDQKGDAKPRASTPVSKSSTVSGTAAAAAAADSRDALSPDDESAIIEEAKKEALAFLCQRHSGADSSGTESSEAQALRQEEIYLTPQQFDKLGTSFDCRSEGIAAYVKVLPSLKKVVIFAFDYKGIHRARDMVNVKSGKVVTRFRSKERGEARQTNSGRTRDTQSVRLTQPQMETAFLTQLNPGRASAGRTEVQEREFVTRKGIKVLVHTGNITTCPVDAIVSPAQENLTHQGGVADTIATAAGTDFLRECREYIVQHGALKATEVAVTSAGALPFQKLLHAVGPQWSRYPDKALYRQLLADAVRHCLEKADTLGFCSLAVSSVGSGVSGAPRQVCARSYLNAVLTFDDTRGDGTTLRTIRFVDPSADIVSIIQEVFGAHWHTD